MQEGSFVVEGGGDAGAAFEFLIDALDGVPGAQAPVMGGGKGGDGEALGEVLLHPDGEFGDGFGVEGDAFPEPCLGGGEIRRSGELKMEQPERSGDSRRSCLLYMPANAIGHFLTHFEAWDIGLGVLQEMKQAALPGDGGKDGLAGSGHAGMGIADDEAGAVEAAGGEGEEESRANGLRPR